MAIALFRMACGPWGRAGLSRALTLEEHTGKTLTRRLRSITRGIPLSYTPGRCARQRGRVMPSRGRKSAPVLQIVAVLLGVSLLAYLVERAGPGRLLQNARNMAWGMLLVIALAGFAHIVKTWAWRLALLGDAKKISFWRTLGLRLVSEAIAQLGVVGLVFGESARVTLLGSGVPMASA